MNFPEPLLLGTLLRRYQRFLADVRLDSGETVTAHCTNTGSLKTCAEPGWRVALSRSPNPKRKLAFTWELVHNGQVWIGINTHLANHLAEEAIRQGWIPELAGWAELQRERRYGENSRIDLLLRDGDKLCYVEVKNVTLLGEDGCLCFPDAVTERGRKHLGELSRMVAAGHRAAMLYVVQRGDGGGFRPAHEIDPAYAAALAEAAGAGVEILAYRARVGLDGIELRDRLALHPSLPVAASRLSGYSSGVGKEAM
ncbi:MAG: DNA/RNA nuclease SfsA [Lentisphaeria bacterium]|jgi:sugar fermentation stimulation protein A|nr:DNA/RNA nuclease SfsA [Lentisphaeria bacterium]